MWLLAKSSSLWVIKEVNRDNYLLYFGKGAKWGANSDISHDSKISIYIFYLILMGVCDKIRQVSVFLSWICIYLFNQYFAPPKEDSEDIYNNFKHNFWLKVMICFRIGPVSAMTWGVLDQILCDSQTHVKSWWFSLCIYV